MATSHTEQRSSGSQNGSSVRDEVRDIRSDVTGISGELRNLAQLEMQLARAEMSESASTGGRAIAWAAGAAILALLTTAFLLVTLMFGLDEAMETWLAALITAGVAGLLTAIAGMLAYSRFKQVSLVPKRAMQSMQEDYRWLQTQIRSNSR